MGKYGAAPVIFPTNHTLANQSGSTPGHSQFRKKFKSQARRGTEEKRRTAACTASRKKGAARSIRSGGNARPELAPRALIGFGESAWTRAGRESILRPRAAAERYNRFRVISDPSPEYIYIYCCAEGVISRKGVFPGIGLLGIATVSRKGALLLILLFLLYSSSSSGQRDCRLCLLLCWLGIDSLKKARHYVGIRASIQRGAEWIETAIIGNDRWKILTDNFLLGDPWWWKVACKILNNWCKMDTYRM